MTKAQAARIVRKIRKYIDTHGGLDSGKRKKLLWMRTQGKHHLLFSALDYKAGGYANTALLGIAFNYTIDHKDVDMFTLHLKPYKDKKAKPVSIILGADPYYMFWNKGELNVLVEMPRKMSVKKLVKQAIKLPETRSLKKPDPPFTWETVSNSQFDPAYKKDCSACCKCGKCKKLIKRLRKHDSSFAAKDVTECFQADPKFHYGW